MEDKSERHNEAKNGMKTPNPNDKYKLYWFHSESMDHVENQHFMYPSINVGFLLSQFIQSNIQTKYICLEVEEHLRKIIHEKSALDNKGISGIILYNTGILLEPDIELNPEKILMDISKEIAIIISWPYKVEQNKRLIWDSYNSTMMLDFPDFTIKKLELENEIQ